MTGKTIGRRIVLGALKLAEVADLRTSLIQISRLGRILAFTPAYAEGALDGALY